MLWIEEVRRVVWLEEAVEKEKLFHWTVVKEERRIGIWRACLLLLSKRRRWRREGGRVEELEGEEVVETEVEVLLVTLKKMDVVKEVRDEVDASLNGRRRRKEKDRRVWKVRRTRRVLLRDVPEEREVSMVMEDSWECSEELEGLEEEE